MRLFISIDFSGEILEKIRSWVPDQKGWRRLPADQLHLTLTFLGECSENEKKEIHEELSAVAFSPFTTTISGLGVFPNESSPRIIWAGMEPKTELLKLQQNISARVSRYIKTEDAHSFVPHITLARKKSRPGNKTALKQHLRRETEELNVYIDSFNLKKSVLKSSGSEHHILHRYTAKSNP